MFSVERDCPIHIDSSFCVKSLYETIFKIAEKVVKNYQPDTNHTVTKINVENDLYSNACVIGHI